MKICLAQIRSRSGEVERNVERHLGVLRGLEPGAPDLVVFPELSLTNYDPGVAAALAMRPSDERLAVFQRHADERGTAVAVGAPLRGVGKPIIAVFVFAPGRAPVVVGKRHLHADEVACFSAAGGSPTVLELGARVGVAICYEVSVAAHAAALARGGADIYLASVAKTPRGVAEAEVALSAIARRHGIPALLVNSVGTCEAETAGGRSMVIDREGRLLRRLGGAEEGLLVYDTETETASELPIAS